MQPAPQDVADHGRGTRRFDWKTMLGDRRSGKTSRQHASSGDTSEVEHEKEEAPAKWNMGMLNDRETDEVPGSVLLLSKVSEYNEPLGLHNAPARTSASSLPSLTRSRSRTSSLRRRFNPGPEKKRTADGKIVLEPQPGDSFNDPLNWNVWRRDASLYSLGFYCLLGGGMTTVLAAGFNDVAQDYNIAPSRVALTTGLYMIECRMLPTLKMLPRLSRRSASSYSGLGLLLMEGRGLGLGNVMLSPTAILFGKRPVYLVAAICFVLSAIWCALSPNFASLICARIFQGVAVSSVECLPSATIAEIYFLHEKGYRLGIYTLLLLGGKNLVPLVSAAIIGSLGWRWVFWIVAIIVGFGGILLFFFVPETFWDRTPVPKKRRSLAAATGHTPSRHFNFAHQPSSPLERKPPVVVPDVQDVTVHTPHAKPNNLHAHFDDKEWINETNENQPKIDKETAMDAVPQPSRDIHHENIDQTSRTDYFTNQDVTPAALESNGRPITPRMMRTASAMSAVSYNSQASDPRNEYTRQLDSQPKQTYIQQLKPWSGRLLTDNWFKVAVRPFILFAYPNILWSALVYALSVGWLIVISESVTSIYESRETYNFTPLQTGLVYISPFIGGVLGTAVAGKVSDLIVRWLARKNGGLYEPEFRLIMAIPITITTVIGLMGYGWSAQERDAWIVPTIFFGVVSFGCCLGSTTSITFALDSYRQYAGEALVTLNFSKNVLHGLVWSLFFNSWLDSDGSRVVFIAIGGIQLACLLTTIPVYIYGKRSRMWTVRKNLMEKF